jgi:hypothetical protein
LPGGDSHDRKRRCANSCRFGFSTRHRIRRGFRFGYKLPLDDFMAFVDAAL